MSDKPLSLTFQGWHVYVAPGGEVGRDDRVGLRPPHVQGPVIAEDRLLTIDQAYTLSRALRIMADYAFEEEESKATTC